MNQRLKVGDRVLDVKVSAPGEDREIRFEIDGKAGAATVVSSVPGRHTVRIGDRVCTLHAVRDRDGAWVWCEGRAWHVTDETEAGRRSRKPRAGASGGVTPPMPAVVVRVLAEPGQKVVRGQVLVVVSAMKLETALVAPYDGTVSAVRTVVGANVMPGEVLVDVEPEGAG